MLSFFINDVVSEENQEFQNKYMINTNFLEYYGIVGAVPERWKQLISEYGRLHDIKNHANILINCTSINFSVTCHFIRVLIGLKS